MIIRLGRPVGEGERRLLGPGLHWSFPYPIDEYMKVPISAIQKVSSTVGWYVTTPEQELRRNRRASLPVNYPLNPLIDGYVLTGRSEHRSYPGDFDAIIFQTRSPTCSASSDASNTRSHSALDNALFMPPRHYKVDDLLTRDVAGFQDRPSANALFELVSQQNLGIEVEECLVQSRPLAS